MFFLLFTTNVMILFCFWHYFVPVATHMHLYMILELMYIHMILELMYRMIWKCDGTYLWIPWCTKEMDIKYFFLPI
jgi:hypothetical protein